MSAELARYCIIYDDRRQSFWIGDTSDQEYIAGPFSTHEEAEAELDLWWRAELYGESDVRS